MTTHYAPKDHVGHYVFPEDCTQALVFDCPKLTGVTFPDGCTQALVFKCPALTGVTFPDGCTNAYVNSCPSLENLSLPKGCTNAQIFYCLSLKSVSFPEGCSEVWVVNCPALESINGKPVNSSDQARPYLEAIAAVALKPGKLDMETIKREDADCGTVACIAGWASVLFPDAVRPEFALVDAIPLLGSEAASIFFRDNAEGIEFLERFLTTQQTEITTA